MHMKVCIFSFDVLKILPPFHFLKIISSVCFWPCWVFTLLRLPLGAERRLLLAAASRAAERGLGVRRLQYLWPLCLVAPRLVGPSRTRS